MGLNFNPAAMLIKAKKNGVSFDNILTLGRQTLYISPKKIRQLARENYIKIDSSDFVFDSADEFFKHFLETKTVTALDYSDYEGCDIVHDMNFPINSELYEKFDVIIDGGTLEHVFNFPTAIKNCMELVKKGGSVFIFTVCNNHTGHGFYQFSPELFFRIFERSNGFSIQDVLIDVHPFPGGELTVSKSVYSVIDPIKVKQRVGLVSKSPAVIMVHAIKHENKSIFSKYPLQSDYAAIFKKTVSPPNSNQEKLGFLRHLLKFIYKILPQNIRNHVSGLRQLSNYSIKNQKFYKKTTFFDK